MRVVRLFVYGSLKRGFSNARELHGAKFEGRITTARGFALYDLGAHPALVRAGQASVEGELRSVSRRQLSALDAFEGCPHLYRREEIELEDGTRAMAYLMSMAAVRGRSRVPDGVWIEGTRDPDVVARD